MSDADLLTAAVKRTLTRPDIPQWMRNPLADVLAAAAVDERNGPGADHHTVALAQALLDPTLHPVTDAGLESLGREHLRDLVRQLTVQRDTARACIRRGEELHPSVHLVGGDGAHWPDCPACRVALALGADVDPLDSWRLDRPGARVTACQVDETVNPKEH